MNEEVIVPKSSSETIGEVFRYTENGVPVVPLLHNFYLLRRDSLCSLENDNMDVSTAGCDYNTVKTDKKTCALCKI